MSGYKIAIVGATGAVGEEILNVLAELEFEVESILPLVSARSAGSVVEFGGCEFKAVELTETSFEENEIDIAFFSAGGSVSAKFAPLAAASGAVVIDNTSHFRMDPRVPLVVPECNPQDVALWRETGIIANPNCSTIQMVQVLKPLDAKFGIERVDVATYQATSGAGKKGMEELVEQLQKFFEFKLDECEPNAFKHRIAMNLIPHIDIFLDNGYTKEEMKMVRETAKILHHEFPVSATCVRVPVLRSHSEAITIKFSRPVTAEEAREVLSGAPSVVVVDEPSQDLYPMPLISTDTNETFVGRIRNDVFDPTIIHLFCCADQIRVGAATNAVRIAKLWTQL